MESERVVNLKEMRQSGEVKNVDRRVKDEQGAAGKRRVFMQNRD